jgi:hypothetical protein
MWSVKTTFTRLSGSRGGKETPEGVGQRKAPEYKPGVGACAACGASHELSFAAGRLLRQKQCDLDLCEQQLQQEPRESLGSLLLQERV